MNSDQIFGEAWSTTFECVEHLYTKEAHKVLACMHCSDSTVNALRDQTKRSRAEYILLGYR